MFDNIVMHFITALFFGLLLCGFIAVIVIFLLKNKGACDAK
jgi:hypothetical protein